MSCAPIAVADTRWFISPLIFMNTITAVIKSSFVLLYGCSYTHQVFIVIM
jgi:hypothetical protein